jgi:ATP/ADP translocase
MFQVLAGDAWASGVARQIFDPPGKTEAGVAFFFVSYILIASVMMLNVVVAVLLDEFIKHVTREKEEADRIDALEKEKRKIKGCLDELTALLVRSRVNLCMRK